MVETLKRLTASWLALFVIVCWLLLFAVGTWVPSSAYMQAVIYDRPLEWNKGPNGEVLLTATIPEEKDTLKRLMAHKWEAGDPKLRGSVEISRVDTTSSSSSTESSGSAEIVIAFTCSQAAASFDAVRSAIFDAPTPEGSAKPPAENDKCDTTEAESSSSHSSASSQPNQKSLSSISPTETQSKKSLRIVVRQLTSSESSNAELSFWVRWLFYLPIGLISGSLVNLASLCVLASIAGEYTRIALNKGESDSAPDVQASMFRGFVVFLFFISGQLIFLGNVPGGPAVNPDLNQLTQSAFVRTAGFASVICLACSYDPAIIVVLLTKISSLIDSATKSNAPIESSSEPLNEDHDSLAQVLDEYVKASAQDGDLPDENRIKTAALRSKRLSGDLFEFKSKWRQYESMPENKGFLSSFKECLDELQLGDMILDDSGVSPTPSPEAEESAAP